MKKSFITSGPGHSLSESKQNPLFKIYPVCIANSNSHGVKEFEIVFIHDHKI